MSVLRDFNRFHKYNLQRTVTTDDDEDEAVTAGTTEAINARAILDKKEEIEQREGVLVTK